MTGRGSPLPAHNDPPDVAQLERAAACPHKDTNSRSSGSWKRRRLRCGVVVMSLTPSFERETGQVILEGLPAGVAGEAPLIPVPGLDLAFDRADGRLCRVVVDTAGTDGSIAVGEQVAAMLIRLFGAEAPSVVSATAAEPAERDKRTALARPRARRNVVEPGPPRRGPGHQPGSARLALVGGRGCRTRRTCRPARAGQCRSAPRPGQAARATGQHRHISASRRSRPGGSGRRRHRRGGRAGSRHPAAGSNRRAFRAAARCPVTDIRIRRGRRGREPREGPGAPGRPAVDARSRPGARRALPDRALALLGPVGEARGRERDR